MVLPGVVPFSFLQLKKKVKKIKTCSLHKKISQHCSLPRLLSGQILTLEAFVQPGGMYTGADFGPGGIEPAQSVR